MSGAVAPEFETSDQVARCARSVTSMLASLRWSGSVAALFTCFIFSTNASAIFCTPQNSPKYYVGPASDGACTDNDIASAIAKTSSASCPVTVYVTNEQSYTGEHLTISTASHGLTVVGVSGTCAVPTIVVCDPALGCSGGTPPQVPIGGNEEQPVISVTGGGSVLLANLAISGGGHSLSSPPGGAGIDVVGTATTVKLNNVTLANNEGYSGGGIGFAGDGKLELQGVDIHQNSAENGGGVAVSGSPGGHVEFVIDDAVGQVTEIQSNSSDFGAGLFVAGNVHLLAVARAPGRILIHDNTGTGGGGGIYFSGSDIADVGLVGAAIYNNTAVIGGGVMVGTSENANSVLRLFSTDAQSPMQISSNYASVWGGGLEVDGTTTAMHATACAFDSAFVDDQAALKGAAVSVEDGGHFVVNPDNDADCDFSAIAALGAVHCDPTVFDCNLIDNHALSRGQGTATSATIEFKGAAQISAQRLHFFENSAQSIVRGTSATAAGSVAFSQCLFDHNDAVNALVSLNGAQATFDSCTFADNTTGTPVFSFDSGLTLTRSIVHQGSAVFPGTTTGLVAQYLLLDGPVQLIGNSTVAYGTDPAFVDEASADYCLQSTSPAIDFAPILAPESASGDLDGNPRVVEIPAKANLHGPRDLGAYEFQQPNEIFANGFDP